MPTDTIRTSASEARQKHNLREVDVDIARDARVVFTGVSGSGKSSPAFGTVYAEAQRRYSGSVAPCRVCHGLGTAHDVSEESMVPDPSRALRRWADVIETHEDLYLPSGVKCLMTLRQLMVVDELTPMALSCALGHPNSARDHAATEAARCARAVRLREWRTAASHIVTIGDCHRLSRRGAWPAYVGGLCGVLGTLAVVGAVVMA
jgi:hypothetical protein